MSTEEERRVEENAKEQAKKLQLDLLKQLKSEQNDNENLRRALAAAEISNAEMVEYESFIEMW